MLSIEVDPGGAADLGARRSLLAKGMEEEAICTSGNPLRAYP